MATAITFGEIERSADRALGYALLARVAKNFVLCIYRLRKVAGPLDELLAELKPDTLEWLAREMSEDGVRLRSRLGELHRVLAEFSRSHVGMTSLPVIQGLARRVRDRTEDLGDIVETMTLATNADFENLVSCCASSLGLKQPEDVVGGMHG